MIKSTAIGNSRSEHNYPKIMVTKKGGTLVFFEEKGRGTVIVEDLSSSTFELGYRSASWDMQSFEPWSGKVVIEQD